MQAAQFHLHADIEDSHWWFTGRRMIMRSLVNQILPPSKQATVVDVGCGTGANLAALARDYDCVGIDPSSKAIELAGSRFPGLRFLCGEAPDDLGGVMAEARLLLLMDVIEHVPDDFSFVSRLLAASAPGTHLLVTVPANPLFWSEHDESNGHYRRYEVERLCRVWAGLPVTTLLLSHYNTRLYPLAQAVRTWSRWRGRATGRAGTDVSLPIRPVNEALRTLFAGEARVLGDLLGRKRQSGFARGLSLIALLRRDAGEVSVRSKPDDIAPDLYDPTTGHRLFNTRRPYSRLETRGGTRDVAGHHRRSVL